MSDPAAGSGERLVLRHALGWLLLSAGLLVGVTHGLGMRPAAGGDLSYLPGVFARSLDNPLQLALLAGWIALLPHWLVLLALRRRPGLAVGYQRFADWAQPLFTGLGFVGTIVGVSLAVAGLRVAMQDQNPDGLVKGLSVAFDTTFLGLGAALTLALFRKAIELSAPPFEPDN